MLYIGQNVELKSKPGQYGFETWEMNFSLCEAKFVFFWFMEDHDTFPDQVP